MNGFHFFPFYERVQKYDFQLIKGILYFLAYITTECIHLTEIVDAFL